MRIPKIIRWLAAIGALLLILMTLFRIAEIINFPPPQTETGKGIGGAYWLGLRYDLRIVSVVCLAYYLLALFKPLNPFKTQTGKKFGFAYWLIVSFGLILFYVFEFGHYAYLGTTLNANVLSLAKEGATSFGMVMESYPVFWILLGLAAGTFLIHYTIRFIYRKANLSDIELTKKNKTGYGIIFFLICAFFIFGRLGQYPLRWSDAFTLGNNYASNMALNPVQSFFSTLKNTGVRADMDKTKAAYPDMVKYLGIENPDSENLNFTRKISQKNTSSETPPNVVLVIAESFSYVKSTMAGNVMNTTPYFDRLSREGIFYTHAFTPSYGTARGVWATITGIPDVDINSTSSRNPSAVNQHTIINDFKDYEKLYYIGGSLSWANIQGLLENNIPGLKTIQQPDYKGPKTDVWGVSDRVVFERANEDFQKINKPFFALIQTADNHRPYTIPDDDREELDLPEYSRDEILKNGFTSQEEINAFRYMDFCIEDFMESAKKANYFDNTIFIFIGDHGTLGDASRYYPDAWTGGGLTSMHVPLLFYAPKLFGPQRIDDSVSQIDILPTVAGLAGISYTNTTVGRDLLSPFMKNNRDYDGVFVFNPNNKSIGLIQDSIFYSLSLDKNLAPEVYHLRNNNPVKLPENIENHYNRLVNSIYETCNYMILNNGKN